MMRLLAYNQIDTMGDEFVNQREDLDPELLAKGIFDEESELPYINVPITFPNMNGICKQCNRSNSFMNWCQPCNSKRFQRQYEDEEKWSSGNKMIDGYINYIQGIANRPSEVIEWIPYERLINIRFFDNNYSKNSLTEIYVANWMDGFIVGWDHEKNNWKRNGTGVEVLLKKIDDSLVHFRSPGDFFNEIKSQFKLNTCDIIIKCYGITRDPYTGTYFMIMQ